MSKQISKLVYVLVLLCCSNLGYSQAQPAAEYLKSMNSFVAGSPEAAQIMKYQNYPVDLFTGTPQISYPIYTVQGKGIALPISFSYHAGGGIKVDEQASNIGLGWMLNAGGEITREIRGSADDVSGGRLGDPVIVDTYVTWIIPGMLQLHQQQWIEAMQGARDMEPDIYFFSFGGFSGKFIYDDIRKEFVCITEKGSMVINLDIPTSTWKIVTDDGSQYYFGVKETTATLVTDMNSPAQANFGSAQTTSWKLSKIVNADATDSIMLNYSFNAYQYYTPGSNLTYQLQNGTSGYGYRAPLNSFSLNSVSGVSKLSSITGPTTTVTFEDDATNRLDIGNNQKPIGKVIVKDAGNNITDIFKFSYGYYDRPQLLGVVPGGAYLKKSLRLDAFTMYGNSEANSNPLSYSFSYNNIQLPARMSFTKDFWGYYNSNTNGGMLAPQLYLAYMNTMLPGADRSVDTSKLRAGILEQVTLPTGGTVRFDYEPNTIGYSIKEATAVNAVRTGMEIFRIMQAMVPFSGNGTVAGQYDTTFTINESPNYVTNNFQGGAIADVGIWPATQTTNCFLDNNLPYFRLEKIAGIAGSSDYSVPFSQTFQCGGASHILLPNGVYKMSAFVAALNNSNVINSIRNFSFSVGYDVVPSNQATSYTVAGLRVKSIVATDPYSNVAQTRRFRYHNPVSDSSYGKFIGTTLSNYQEINYAVTDIWLIRTGSYNLPGMGSAASNVVYPKVIEEVTDGSTVYRVEHNYSTGLAIYPNYGGLLPPLDIECARGNEERTDYKKYAGGTFINDKTVKRVFNFDPAKLANPSQTFARKISGIRCAYDSYTGGVGDGGSPLPPQTIEKYWTNVNRLYMTSDTTIEYEGGTPKMTTWNSYKYGDFNQQLVESVSQDSKGAINMQRLGYAKDKGEAALAAPAGIAASLVLANRVSDVLASRSYKDGQLLNQMIKRGHFNGSQYLVDSVLTAEYSNPLEREIRVVDYDDRANPLTLEGRGSLFRKYIWRKDRNLALATCTMATNNNFVFTSFEYPNEYPTIVKGGRTPVYNFSGSYAYYLNGSLVFPGFDGVQPLELYVWFNQGSFTVNGIAPVNTGRRKGDWVLYKVALPPTTTVTINGQMVIDQLVIVPAGSSFDGNVHDAAGRVTAKINQNMQTTFFEYDAMGRLTRVKDEQGNIIKSSDYQYQVTQ